MGPRPVPPTDAARRIIGRNPEKMLRAARPRWLRTRQGPTVGPRRRRGRGRRRRLGRSGSGVGSGVGSAVGGGVSTGAARSAPRTRTATGRQRGSTDAQRVDRTDRSAHGSSDGDGLGLGRRAAGAAPRSGAPRPAVRREQRRCRSTRSACPRGRRGRRRPCRARASQPRSAFSQSACRPRTRRRSRTPRRSAVLRHGRWARSPRGRARRPTARPGLRRRPVQGSIFALDVARRALEAVDVPALGRLLEEALPDVRRDVDREQRRAAVLTSELSELPFQTPTASAYSPSRARPLSAAPM